MSLAIGESAATERVIQYVRGLILDGRLGPGQRLPPERTLVDDIGVSRTSVRAGLQALAAKGILVIRHGAGTFVADGPPVLDSEPLRFLAALHGFTRREMFEARRALEVGAAGLAAERAKADDLITIAEEVTEMFASVDDPQAFLAHDVRFHRAIAVASGNPIVASLVEMVTRASLSRELRIKTQLAAPATGRTLRAAADMHRRIYHAIRDRDRARAEREMADHLLASEREQDDYPADHTAPHDTPRTR
ncbi:MAG TPA: FadR/GntR family transcriptional regulator [Vicinamibacterales bacterium]|jgi:GntR family transcriptional repressor for pyruvate dehydrogenase complex|nr:FadR/GntR family transcriptional regulator [Vicinamibacterales bacterium]